jgi:hypothetical protein
LTEHAKQLNQQTSSNRSGLDMLETKASGAGRKTYAPGRLIAFTDAVMAVAITLLVLDLKLPQGVTDAELPNVLAKSSHSVWCYVLSFLVIGLLWMAHHNQFSFISRIDAALLWLNLLFLLTIGLIPFVTSVMSDHGSALPHHALCGRAVLNVSIAGGHLGVRAPRPGADGSSRAGGGTARGAGDADPDRARVRPIDPGRLAVGLSRGSVDLAAGAARRPRRHALRQMSGTLRPRLHPHFLRTVERNSVSSLLPGFVGALFVTVLPK